MYDKMMHELDCITLNDLQDESKSDKELRLEYLSGEAGLFRKVLCSYMNVLDVEEYVNEYTNTRVRPSIFQSMFGKKKGKK